MHKLRQELMPIKAKVTIPTISFMRTTKICRHGHPRTLPRATQRNKFVTVMTDKYFKKTRAVPTAKTSATQVANIFSDHRVIQFGIPRYVLTENDLQVIRNFFTAMCE